MYVGRKVGVGRTANLCLDICGRNQDRPLGRRSVCRGSHATRVVVLRKRSSQWREPFLIFEVGSIDAGKNKLAPCLLVKRLLMEQVPPNHTQKLPHGGNNQTAVVVLMLRKPP